MTGKIFRRELPATRAEHRIFACSSVLRDPCATRLDHQSPHHVFFGACALDGVKEWRCRSTLKPQRKGLPMFYVVLMFAVSASAIIHISQFISGVCNVRACGISIKLLLLTVHFAIGLCAA